MSEKCDLCHLKLAAILSIFQAFAASRSVKKHVNAPFTYRGDNGGQSQKYEMLFQGNYHSRHQHKLSK
ncbi:hypothetical protein DXF93_08305 [Escherichia coli]|nr:hypothetical protein DXF93_08305 [Escherichia coli]